MFRDSDKFEVVENWGRTRIQHKRDIGPDSSWADRTIHGVSLDDSCAWELSSTLISTQINKNKGSKQGSIIVGGRHVMSDILNSVSDFDGFGERADTRDKKNYFRKRKIPKSKKKNFTVKPVTDIQREKHEKTREDYDNIVYSKEFEEKVEYDGVLEDIMEEPPMKDYPEIGNEFCYVENIPGIPCSKSNDTKYYIDTTGSRQPIPPSPECPDGAFTEDIYRVVRYNPVKDEYAYSNIRERGPSELLDRALWCPPKNWFKPVIHWDKIFSKIDLQQLGYRRSYTYDPPSYGPEGWTEATIKFHDHNL